MKSKIKIALLIDEYILNTFNSEVVKNINQSHCSEIILIIKKNTKIKKASIKPLHRRIFEINYKEVLSFYLARQLNRYFIKRYNLLYKNLIKEKIDLRNTNPEAKVLEVCPFQTKYCDVISNEDLELIKTEKIDVILRIGFRILKGGILNSSKYGVWSYHHGDNDLFRGSSPGFWEVFHEKEKTGAILQILNNNLDAGTIICKTFIRTERQSFLKNQENILFKSTKMVSENLDKIYNYGEEIFYNTLKKQNKFLNIYSQKLQTKPETPDLAMVFFRDIKKRLINKISKNKSYEWSIIYNFSNLKNIEFRKFKQLKANKGTYWADPFVVFFKNKYFIFFEEFSYVNQKGHISCLEISENGIRGKSKVILSEKHHLSYPYIFEFKNQFFIVPESNEKRTIDIYKADKFPYSWSFHKTIFKNIKAHDSSILYYDNYWWLFTNLCANEWTSPNEDLYLFYSEDIFSSNWTPHPMNPVVSDVEVARGAGKIFVSNNKIYRPSQNNIKRYGYGFNINEIEELNTKFYKERKISRAAPDWGKNVKGIHTFNFSNNLVVSDIYGLRGS